MAVATNKAARKNEKNVNKKVGKKVNKMVDAILKQNGALDESEIQNILSGESAPKSTKKNPKAAQKGTKAAKTPKVVKVAQKATPKAAKVVKVKVATEGKVHGYRVGSSYWAICESLRTLGTNRWHHADALIKQFPKTLGTEAFKAFKNKSKRNDETGKDCEGRIVQNAIVVNRVDYGAPLRELGYEVRKMRDEKGYQFGLFKMSAK